MSEFEDVFGDWLTHVVVVEPYLGAGIEGVSYGAPQQIGGDESSIADAELMVERKRRLIRSSDGNEIVSETTLYVSHAAAAAFPLHSRVTLDGDEVTTVERVAPMDVYGLFDHVVVSLA